MIDNEFVLLKVLGKGGSSKVFLAQDSQGNKFALKAIRKDKNYGISTAASMLEREHELLQKLDSHPNIIKSYKISLDGIVVANDESEPVMYNILEYAKHGAISNFIRYTGAIEEDISRLLALQICNAIQYIHEMGFVHLDLKLENILLDEYFNAKVADMGSSCFVLETNGFTDKRRGTLQYMAPEVVNLQQGQAFDGMAADIYSLGVTIFVMLTGEFPIPYEINNSMSTNDSGNKSIDDPKMEESEYEKSSWANLSKEAKDLIQAMIQPDPSKRPSISEVL